ncbi:MAG: biotin--[acetyl-CoA-carboxylase] ligase [Candidatus Kapabacteria bacterium]|nr:biotin--[acetyl-CoA-carboxylase] ligase [Ignavibacteriota bacterium]MCW5885180.1 biotin--[acetyl-CoA-carboxylase] ligase [Candidatus Kapabacteria bacterium]
MIILTDNIDFAGSYFRPPDNSVNNYGTPLTGLLEKKFFLFDSSSYQYELPFWKYGFITKYAEESQFDALMELSGQKIQIPDKIFCMADSGKKFHGFRNRKWESHTGNIHLSCYFKPYVSPGFVGLGFTMLAAVSVVETLNEIPQLNGMAKIKWVNDILIGSSKICGVIAQTQIQGDKVTDAVIGIGLNVESVPKIQPTSFVPTATSVNKESSQNYSAGYISHILLKKISENYNLLINEGVQSILKKYKENSLIMGRKISIWTDPHQASPVPIRSGIVKSIGDYLEIYLENSNTPITDGRIVLE